MSLKTKLYNLVTDADQGFFSGLLKVLLWVLSLVYGMFIRILLKIRLAQKKKAPCKIISIGNITAGGTGKTTIVAFVASLFRHSGKRVAIISRGYKRSENDALGDEPRMLEKLLNDIPVVVDADRLRGINHAFHKYGTEIAILDDGFQQWHIQKDLEIVAIDAASPFANGHMFPRGLLREPLASLGRADIFLLTKTDLIKDLIPLKQRLKFYNPRAMIVESVHRPRGFYAFDQPFNIMAAETFKGKNVFLFCGIGNPDSFEQLIRSLGCVVSGVLKFPDHYRYTDSDCVVIKDAAVKRGAEIIITTEKDIARLNDLKDAELRKKLYCLRIALEITSKNGQEFNRRLLSCISL